MPQVQSRPSQAGTVRAPKRLPLVVMPDNRDLTSLKDAKLINGYAEKDPLTGDWQVYKRFGYGAPQYTSTASGGRGMYQWTGSVSTSFGPFTTNLTAGADGSGDVGYSEGSMGSLEASSTAIGEIITIADASDGSVTVEIESQIAPPKDSFDSITVNGVTLLTNAANYSRVGGSVPKIAVWNWPASTFSMVSGTQYSVSIAGPFVPVYTSAPKLLAAFGQKLVVVSETSPPTQTEIDLPEAGGKFVWCAIPAATPLVMFSDGITGGYYTDGTTVTKITDGNYPSSTVPGIVILDGTIYVMDVLAKIWGSTNPNDPTTWSALNFIRAQLEGDLGVYLARQLNYVVALKQWTTEFFYDAGNPPPGSPLAPVQGAMLNYGCLNAQSVQVLDNLLIWVSQDKSGTAQIAILENLQMRVVSTEAVERLISNLTPNSSLMSQVLHLAGHRIYVLTATAIALTLAYDVDSNLWYYWTDSTGSFWPMIDASYDIYGNVLVQGATGNAVYPLDVGAVYPTDNGAVVPFDLYTPNFDAGINRRKMLNMLWISADQQPGSLLRVSYSDDDYQTWSEPREIDLGEDRPSLDREGTFWRRAYRFSQTSPQPLRIRAVDLQLDIGTL